MPAIESHSGLTATGLPHYIRDNFTSIAAPYQKYVFLPMMKRRIAAGLKVGEPLEVSRGRDIRWKIVTASANSSKQMDMYEGLNPQPNEHVVEAVAHLRISEYDWVMNEIEETMGGGTPEEIISLRRVRRYEAEQGFADHLEAQGVGVPSSTSDTKAIEGLRYWIFGQRESSSGTVSGAYLSSGAGDWLNFNLSAFTAGPGGQSRVTYKRWGNWYQQYGAVDLTSTGLVRKIRHAMNMTEFFSPVDYPELKQGASWLGIYLGVNELEQLEDLLYLRNDANGNDLAGRDGMGEIRRIRPQRWPYIETLSNAPVYGINWSVFCPFFLRGFNIMERVMPQSNNPLVKAYTNWLVWGLKCYRPDQCFVLTT